MTKGAIIYHRKTFFDHIKGATSALTQKQVDGFETLLTAAETRGYTDLFHNAYVIATTWHETAAKMQPIREYGRGRGRPYGRPLPEFGNQIAYGRGYVQLTWARNYVKADRELQLMGTLINDFDRALEPEIAARVIFRGMTEGWFTGRAMDRYINEGNGSRDYMNARRVVNGTDKMRLIASYAYVVEDALRAARDAQKAKGPGLPDVPEPIEPELPATVAMDDVLDLIKRETGAADVEVVFNLKFDE